MVYDRLAHALYIIDAGHLRQIDLTAKSVSTLIGSSATARVGGYVDGEGGQALFWDMVGIAAKGNALYVTERVGQRVRKILLK